MDAVEVLSTLSCELDMLLLVFANRNMSRPECHLLAKQTALDKKYTHEPEYLPPGEQDMKTVLILALL